MSTEPSPTPEGGETPAAEGRRAGLRRGQLPVVAVAAAVLLAGGGGAYWASTATGGGPAAPGGSAAPPPLALDGMSAQQAAAEGPGKDAKAPVAPGEPHGAPPLRVSGELPEGPDSAPVQRPSGELRKAQVAALAEALDISGKPEHRDGRWTVSASGEQDGAVLTVSGERAGSSWTYRPGPQAGSADAGGNDDGSPVTAQDAKDAVRPALKALGAEGAGLDAGRTTGDVRQVTVAPEVGGLPTYAWGGSFSVGPDGEISHAHGKLGKLSQAAEYPVMSAEETLKQLNERRAQPRPEVRCMSAAGTGEAAEPAEPGAGVADIAPCGPSDPLQQRSARVTDAEFGLSAQQSRGEPVLVPSWIYDVQLPDGDGTAQVAHPAVQPEHVKPGDSGGSSGDGDSGSAPDDSVTEQPGTPAQPGDGDEGKADDPHAQAIDTYEADGRTLKLTFWAGVCETYRATATEHEKSVEVKVRPEKPDEDKVCVKIAKRQTLEVQLDEPLGDRKVINARDGEELPQAK